MGLDQKDTKYQREKREEEWEKDRDAKQDKAERDCENQREPGSKRPCC